MQIDIRSLAAVSVAVTLGLTSCGATPHSNGATASPGLKESLVDVSLAHDTPQETATREQLLRLLATYDLRPWLFTRKILIDEKDTPHSHPVLTLHTRHLAHDDQLLSTFIHEQIHWFLDSRDARTVRAADELCALFPGLPVGFPEGAQSEKSSYEHLLVIFLEFEGLRRAVGEARAGDVFRFWERDHYRALYRTVRENREKVGQTLAHNDLIPPFLHLDVAVQQAKRFENDPGAADDYPRAAPGVVDEDAVDRLVREAEASHSDALLVLKDGNVVCERYFDSKRGPMETMSVTKSFVSLAIGSLLADGKIPSLDVPLSHYFPEFSKGVKSKVTLRHVLTHTSGIAHRPAAGVLTKQEDRLAYVRSLPVVEEPGTKFSYNNEAVQLLSGVIASAAHEPVDAYLDARLFQPLGIRDWSWAKDKKGNVATFYGLSLSARDLAKVALTVLGGGRYRGQDIVPSSWIAQSTRPASQDVSSVGLLWWIEDDGPWVSQTEASLRSYAPASVVERSKLAPLDGRLFESKAAYWTEVGALLTASERESFVSVVRDVHVPFTTVPAHPVGFRADGWLGQYIVVYPEFGLVGVRQHREPDGGADETDNETYGFKEFPVLVRQLAPARKP